MGGRKLLVTSASLLVTGALLVVTMFATRNKCLTTSNNKNLIRIVITSKGLYDESIYDGFRLMGGFTDFSQLKEEFVAEVIYSPHI